MLASLTLPTTSLGDNVYRESINTNDFSVRLAKLFGKPAACYVISGTMGNLLSLRANLSHYPSPYSVVLDTRSHVYCHEAGGLSELAKAWPIGYTPPILVTEKEVEEGTVTLDMVKQVWVGEEQDGHFSRSRVLSLENTIKGQVLPLETIKEITDWVRSKGGRTHLDGARFWEAVSSTKAGQNKTEWNQRKAVDMLKAYSDCFDTVTVCFSKGLGAPIGSYVLGSVEDIERVERYRKQTGGDGRQVGLLAAMMEVGLDETFLSGKLWESQRKVEELTEYYKSLGGKLACQSDTNMIWMDLESLGVSDEDWGEIAKRRGINAWSRLVFHFRKLSLLFSMIILTFGCRSCRRSIRQVEAGYERFDGVCKEWYCRWQVVKGRINIKGDLWFEMRTCMNSRLDMYGYREREIHSTLLPNRRCHFKPIWHRVACGVMKQ
jgi:threonine aldolase